MHGSSRYSPLVRFLVGVGRSVVELMILIHCYIQNEMCTLQVCQTYESIFVDKGSSIRVYLCGSVPFRHFGSFDSFACLFFSLFAAYRAVLSGSTAVLRGRDCTASFYCTQARRRQLSKLEPDRELRGRLAKPYSSLFPDFPKF